MRPSKMSAPRGSRGDGFERLKWTVKPSASESGRTLTHSAAGSFTNFAPFAGISTVSKTSNSPLPSDLSSSTLSGSPPVWHRVISLREKPHRSLPVLVAFGGFWRLLKFFE